MCSYPLYRNSKTVHFIMPLNLMPNKEVYTTIEDYEYHIVLLRMT